MFGGKMPAITPAQVKAVAAWGVAQAIAWGWISSDQGQTLLSAGATIISAVLVLADAFLRAKRAQAVATNPSAFPEMKK
jgi:hypothetical protein